MKNKCQVLGLLLGAFIASSHAGIVNGSVDNRSMSDAGSINVSSDLDQGWHARSASLYDLSENDIWSTGLINQPGYWFGQIFTDSHATYGDVMLEFEVTYKGANIRSAMLQYAIYGTDSTDASATVFALNTDLNPAGRAWALLNSGAVSTPEEGIYQTNMTFSGAAYQYLAVRFRFTGTTSGRGTDYATAVDNISISSAHSVIPEPAAMALVSLGGAVTLAAGRFNRRNQ